MSGLSDEDRDALYANDLALDNLHSDWGRGALEAAVEQIVAAHVTSERNRLADEIEARAELHRARATYAATHLSTGSHVRERVRHLSLRSAAAIVRPPTN